MKRLLNYVPSALILTMIFMFSTQNGSDSGHLSTMIYEFLASLVTLPFSQATMTFLIRKAAHMTEFGLLALSLYWGMKRNGHVHLFIAPLLWSAFFAALDETHQLFVSGRAGQVRDVLIDTLGAFLYLLMLFLIKKFIKNKPAS